MARSNPAVPPQLQYGPVIIPDHRPYYKIVGQPFFGPDDTLYVEGSIIGWDKEPNQSMQPLNVLARKNMKTFLEKLDKFGREAAEKAGRSYTSLADAHEVSYALAKKEGREVDLLNVEKHVPIMKARKDIDQIDVIEAKKETPQMGTVGKLSLGSRNEMVDAG